MRKIIIILAVILSSSLVSNAQVSGYMGKKFMFMYDLHTRPSFALPNANGNSGFTSFNAKHSFSVEYVTAEHTSMGVSYSFFNTMFDFNELQVLFEGASSQFSPTFHPEGLGSMSVKNYSVYLKLFSGSNIAPLGTYMKLQFDYFAWDSKYDWTQNGTNDPEIASFAKSVPQDASNSSFGLSINFGNQLVYFDHLVLNTSLQFGFLFNGGFTAAFGSSDPGLSNFPTNIEATKYATSARIFSQNLWNINVGIGYLIF